jgi:hypothetical protein
MPIVTCPGCERKIELPFHELAWNIQCKVCGISFTPAGQTGALQNDEDGWGPSEVPELCASERSMISTLVILGLGVGTARRLSTCTLAARWLCLPFCPLENRPGLAWLSWQASPGRIAGPWSLASCGTIRRCSF